MISQKGLRIGFSKLLISFNLVCFCVIFFNIKNTNQLVIAILVFVGVVIYTLPTLKSSFRVYEPSSIFIILLSHGFLLQIAYLFVVKKSSFLEVDFTLQGNETIYLKGISVYLLAICSFFFAYHFFFQKNITSSFFQIRYNVFNEKKFYYVMLSFTIISFICTIIYLSSLPDFSLSRISGKRFIPIKEGESRLFSYIYYFYKIGANIAAIVSYFCFAYYNHIKADKKIQLLFFIASFIVIGLSIVNNSRAGLLIWLLTNLLILVISKKKIVLNIGRSILLLGIIVIFNAFILISRSGSDFLSLLKASIFSLDFLDIKRSSIIINVIPEKLHFLYGESLIGWLFVLVPKSIWNDKPMFTEQGSVIAKQIFSTDHPIDIYPGLMVESFWNFGFVGVAIVFFLFGLLAKIFYTQLDSKNIIAIIFYALFLTHGLFIGISHSLGTGILKYLLMIFPMFLMYLSFRTISINRKKLIH